MAASSASAAVQTAEGDRRIVAFIVDETSGAAVRAGLSALGEALDLRRGGLRAAIRFFRTLAPVHAVLIDISDVPDPRADLDELARTCPPDISVFLFGDSTDIAFYRLLVHELGVTDYIPKPLTRDLVQRLLLPRLSGTAPDLPDARSGHLVAVCGARGGAGATTIAVNLGLQLAGMAQGQTAVLDLHLRNGSAAMMLSARPGPGLRIALEEPARSDALFLERATITVDPRLRLVAAEEAHDPPPVVTVEGVDHVLDLLRHKFNFVLVDLPVPVPVEMRRVLTLARQVVVVLQPDLPSLRDAQALRQMVLIATGSDRVVTVLNRADMRGGLSRELVTRGLGHAPDIVIPDLGRRMIEAVNLGAPALARVPALRRHLLPLVGEVTGLRTAARRSWFGRLVRR